MKSFAELGISVSRRKMVGKKIRIREILNLPIEVHACRISDSRFQKGDNEKCLQLQIILAGEKRVVFTGGRTLMEQVQQVPEEAFPFTTKIIQEGEMFMFI